MIGSKSLLIILAGATGYAAVVESDAYPMIEYWQAEDYRANPLCDVQESSQLTSGVADFPYRKSAGLQTLSARLKEFYTKLVQQGYSRVDFEATNRYTGTDYESLLHAALVRAMARRRAQEPIGAKPLSVSAEVCELLTATPVESKSPAWPQLVASSRTDTEAFCKAMNGVAQDIYCQDNYIYHEASTTVYSKSLGGDVDQLTDPDINSACYQEDQSTNTNPLDLKIQQYRITPDSLEWANVESNEKKVYYLLYKSILAVEQYAERKLLQAQLQSNGAIKTKTADYGSLSIHELFNDNEIFEHILPEWSVIRVIYTNEVTETTSLRLPFAIISQRGSSILVTLRQSLTNFESRFALYNQLSFKYLYNFTGQLHDGSATYFQSIVSPIIYEVSKALKNIQNRKTATEGYTPRRETSYNTPLNNARNSGSNLGGESVGVGGVGSGQPLLKLTVTASNSPGIGTAAAVGNHISRLFGKDIQVDVVGFGSPYFADADLINNLRNNVELRVVQMEGDSSDMLSCPRTISCDHNDLIIRTGVESGVLYDYERAHGYIQIPLSYMASLDEELWGSEMSLLQLAAIRECGYGCALSLGACGFSLITAEADKCFAANCLAVI